MFGLLVLSGCSSGGSTTQKTTDDDKTRIIDSASYDFNVRIPREWDVIEAKEFTSDVPPQTVIVFRNNVKNEDFTANVNIIRNTLQNSKETLDYAKQVLNRQKNGLYNYKESGRDLVQVSITGKKSDTYLTHFEAKKDPSSDLTRFVQTYAVKGTEAYIVTGSMSPKENENNIKTVEDIVKSFTIK
jgi:hypothetical protein